MMKQNLTIGEAVSIWSVLVTATVSLEMKVQEYIEAGSSLGANLAATKLVAACRAKALINGEDFPFVERVVRYCPACRSVQQCDADRYERLQCGECGSNNLRDA